jgi:hypothetical protein
LTFRRNFGIREEAEFEGLTDLLALVQLSEANDSVTWVLENSGTTFTLLPSKRSSPLLVNPIDGSSVFGKLNSL